MRKSANLIFARYFFVSLCTFFFSASVLEPRSVLAEELSLSACLNPPNHPQDNARNRGSNFVAWQDLDSRQKYLLQTFFGTGYADTSYTELTVKQDGKAATFLAVTNALKLTRISLNDEEEISALDLVTAVREIRTDRLILKMDLDTVNEWRKAGGKYTMTLSRNQKETSRVVFATHTLPSGGLHCGYDLNWYTKANKTPHLHWNMRFSDGQADVHLDGYPAYLMGLIPNPFHLTYQNSDVRYWINKYLKKYGPAGFSVSRRR